MADGLIITASNSKQFLTCRRAWYCRQELCLVPKYTKPSLSIGKAFHKGEETGSIDEAMKSLDIFYPSNQEDADSLEIAKATVQAMLEGYWKRFPKYEDSRAEVQFEIPILSPKGRHTKHVLRGKIDRTVPLQSRNWLQELKTATKVDRTYIERLDLDHQFTTYFYAAYRLGLNPAGGIYRMVRKPSIRPKKNETIPQFCERLIGDYQERPEFYFFEERLYRTQQDLKEFEAELWGIVKDIQAARKENRWYRSTGRCGDWGRCDYLPLCRGVEGSEEFYKFAVPNQELEEVEEVGDAA